MLASSTSTWSLRRTTGTDATDDGGDPSQAKADSEDPLTQELRKRINELSLQVSDSQETVSKLTNSLTSLRIAALADVVDDIVVETENSQMMSMKRVFLTNRQAMQFTPEMITDLLKKMDIAAPPDMVILINPISHTR